jgi:hypothetical protein
MIQNRSFLLPFRSFALLLVLVGLLAHVGVFSGSFRPSQLMYYTIQSNILAVLLFFILLRSSVKAPEAPNTEGGSSLLARFEMICVVDLLLTFVVYWTMLAPPEFAKPNGGHLWKFDNLAVHFFAPMLCLIDYILFTKRGHLKYRDAYIVLVFPLSYVLCSSAAGLSGYTYGISADGLPKHSPYFFLDFERIGAHSFAYIAFLAIGLLLMSHTMFFLDKKAVQATSQE